VKTPLLSVIIPTWNRAQLVSDAINSALAQRPGEVEVIVVDDASTDSTVALLEKDFGSRIQLLRLQHRRGPGAARNAGARLAQGELIGFLDSDDVWLAGKLDAELRVLTQFAGADVVVSDSQNFFESQPDGTSRFAQNGLLKATQGEARMASGSGWLWTNSMNTAHTCSITVRREALSGLGEKLFAEDLVCCEDWEFQMRLYHRCGVVVLPQVWSHVRRFADASRPGRGVPGRPTTAEQELVLLRARMTVIERSGWLHGLDATLAEEFERFRNYTANELFSRKGAKAKSGALIVLCFFAPLRETLLMIIEEVHLWRGSEEQRALRSQLTQTGQFAYFDEQLGYPDWRSKTILDFGGNKGYLLLDPCCTIRQQNYYCLDVISEAIAEGREAFPAAHWIHYDRYNCSFNPAGVVDLPVPDLGIEFDLILAYSVFTHTTWAETKDLIEQLTARLAPGGRLAFTFIDPHWNANLRWRLEKRNSTAEVETLLEQSRDGRWCSLVNGTRLFVDSSGEWEKEADDCITYNVYYTEEFLREHCPRATIKRPVNGEMQHCCIVSSED
jgi:SAM-dependent methyltransferase